MGEMVLHPSSFASSATGTDDAAEITQSSTAQGAISSLGSSCNRAHLEPRVLLT